VKYDLLADQREIRKALDLIDDSRFADYSFAKAAEKATAEILGALRPAFLTDQFKLSNLTNSTLNGVVTTGGTNSLTDSGIGWTASEFVDLCDCEVLIWGTDDFYVADITANTTEALTISSIDGSDITVETNDVFYIRRKIPALNDMATKLGLYHFTNDNRAAQGMEELNQIAEDYRSGVYAELSEYLSGVRDLPYLSNSESVTLNGSYWQYLTYQNVVDGTVTVSKDGTTYREDIQGYELNLAEGAIRYKASSYTTYLDSSDTVTVTYQYSPRNRGYCG